MNKVSLYTLIGLFALCSCACGGKDPVPSTDPDPKPEPPVEVYDATLWTTTFDKTRDFEKSGVAFGKAATMSPNVVRRRSRRWTASASPSPRHPAITS